MSNSKYYCKIKIEPKKVTLDDGKLHDRLIYIHSNNLLSLTEFLDNKYPDWCWFNVFDNHDKSKQIASFTKNKRPNHQLVVTYEKYARQ